MVVVEERAQATACDYDISGTVDGAAVGAGVVGEAAAAAAVTAGEGEPGAAWPAVSWAADDAADVVAAAARHCSAADIGPAVTHRIRGTR